MNERSPSLVAHVPSMTAQICLFGVPGTGKSTKAREVVGKLADPHFRGEYMVGRRVIVHDPVQDWQAKGVHGYRLFSWRDHRKDYLLTYVEDDEDLRNVLLYEKNCILVIDETMHLSQDLFPLVRKVAVTRRHRGITLVFCSQRPMTIPKETLSLSNDTYCFHVHDPDDVKRLASVLPEHKLMRVSTLSVEKHEYVRHTLR